MDHYIQRERSDAAPGDSAYEYALRPTIQGGLVVVERWIRHSAAVKRAGEDGLAFGAEDAADWAAMLGCAVTTFAAPAIVVAEQVDPETAARRRVEAHAATKSRAWREARGLVNDADRAEDAERERQAADDAKAQARREQAKAERATKSRKPEAPTL